MQFCGELSSFKNIYINKVNQIGLDLIGLDSKATNLTWCNQVFRRTFSQHLFINTREGETYQSGKSGRGRRNSRCYSQWTKIQTKNLTRGRSEAWFHLVAPHERSCMQALWQQPAPRLARTELFLTMGELYPTDRVYSLQSRSAQYLSFRWMIKWVAQQEVKQLEFLPHYHGNLISGIMRY